MVHDGDLRNGAGFVSGKFKLFQTHGFSFEISNLDSILFFFFFHVIIISVAWSALYVLVNGEMVFKSFKPWPLALSCLAGFNTIYYGKQFFTRRQT